MVPDATGTQWELSGASGLMDSSAASQKRSSQHVMGLRPPVGFIVEGDGEFHFVRSFVAHATGMDAGSIPVQNAGGCTTLVTNFEEILSRMVVARKPHAIIVTIDSRDFRKHPSLADCRALRAHLQTRADLWLTTHANTPSLQPLPTRIAIVIQHRAFETWLIADVDGLRTSSEVALTPADVADECRRADAESRELAARSPRARRASQGPKSTETSVAPVER